MGWEVKQGRDGLIVSCGEKEEEVQERGQRVNGPVDVSGDLGCRGRFWLVLDQWDIQ